MSCSTLQAIWPGEKHENIREFRNSHGTAPIIWGECCTRFLRKPEYWWLMNYQKRDLWDLIKTPSVPEHVRAVLLFTCDHIYVAKDNYRRFAADLRKLLDETKVSANHVNHWPLIAQFFEMEPDYPAVAIWCTSVTADPWSGEYNDEAEGYEPFDWEAKGWSLYAELDSYAAEGTKGQ